jgi:hypothetical protein
MKEVGQDAPRGFGLNIHRRECSEEDRWIFWLAYKIFEVDLVGMFNRLVPIATRFACRDLIVKVGCHAIQPHLSQEIRHGLFE